MTTKKKENPQKAGRKSKFDGEKINVPFDLKRIEFLGGLGMIDTEIATILGISEKTLYNYKNKYPEFLQAIKRGKVAADSDVIGSLYKRCLGFHHKAVHITNYKGRITQTDFIKRYPPDTLACIIWLKNRRPDLFRDKQEVEHSLQGLGALFQDDPNEAEDDELEEPDKG